MRPKRKKIYIIFIFFFSVLLSGLTPSIDGEEDTAGISEHYDALIREIKILEEEGYDISTVKDMVEDVNELLSRQHYTEARHELASAHKIIKNTRRGIPDEIKRTGKRYFILAYADVLQKLALLIVIALIAVYISPFRKIIMHEERPSNALFLFFLYFTTLSFLACFLQLMQFGSMSLVFFDPQLVLVMLSGLLGGMIVGLICGILNCIFRYLLVVEYWFNALLPLIAGLVGGFMYMLYRERKDIPVLPGLAGGAVIGLIQGLLIYLPLFDKMSFVHFFFSIGSLIVLEAGGVFLFLFVISHFIQVERMRTTTELFLRMKLQFLQAQINPHFLFNVLNTIATTWKDEAELGKNLIVKLSSYLRNIIGREDIMIPLCEELDNIRTYLEIEEARFRNRLTTDVIIDVPRLYLDEKIPILVLQPLVENALKHGLRNKESDARLIIGIKNDDTNIIIAIEDNGCGMTQEQVKTLLQPIRRHTNEEGLGIGLGNVNERLVTLYGNHYGLRFESAEDKGTTVFVTIPKSKGVS